MKTTDAITIDLGVVHDWDTYHSLMKESFGFPDFYGRNGNAFIDCLSDIDDPETGMCGVSVKRGGTFTVCLQGWRAFAADHGEIATALIEEIDFVNMRLKAQGDGTRIDVLKEEK